MPDNNFPQEDCNNATVTLTVNGQSIEVLPPYNPNSSSVEQYVPSVQFRKQVHKRVESLEGNLSGFFDLYSLWVKGETKCDYTVVMEMTMRANVLASQLRTISKACKDDRFDDTQPSELLTIREQVELIEIASELNVSPSEALTIIRRNIDKVV
ncbi:hypothetical protein VB525_05720 [Vibrio parahaemolyticus]|uniref:hypothetical protein n=1 Tax=Vibrio parahaemolyticus TaxID=670 RepID=UPI002B1EEAA6|nr:hypothetical protein [Vibrio parahaemolyticus]MEA5313395.1 hypothetical protein [Vibrio parahaemolyticus]